AKVGLLSTTPKLITNFFHEFLKVFLKWLIYTYVLEHVFSMGEKREKMGIHNNIYARVGWEGKRGENVREVMMCFLLGTDWTDSLLYPTEETMLWGGENDVLSRQNQWFIELSQPYFLRTCSVPSPYLLRTCSTLLPFFRHIRPTLAPPKKTRIL
ncbi:MAG: hypothetical protein Q4D56_11390, partial [Bacteroides sp.]|nr:hypothetical protein [Bacteroides sp.]